jgi:hypothetical protein
MRIACGNQPDAGKAGHLDWGQDRFPMAEAELSTLIPPPGPNGAIGLERDAKTVARGNGGNPRKDGRRHGHREGLVVGRSGPKGAQTTFSPSINGSVRSQRQTVVKTR